MTVLTSPLIPRGQLGRQHNPPTGLLSRFTTENVWGDLGKTLP